MNSTEITSICIVGGGTAGWLTAAFFLQNRPTLKITLIESPNIPTVGVGEATILNFDKFLKYCGFDESEWMPECDAIYKAGILYPDWRGNGIDVWHPFAQTPRFKENRHITMADAFYNTDLDPALFYQLVLSNYDNCVIHNKVPIAPQMAYHLDAVKLAAFITKKVSPRISYYKEDVVEVESDGKDISKLTITNAGDIVADLYIDCTGFKRLLSSKIAGSKWIDKSYMLPNNAAIATPVSYVDQPNEMKPYTTAQPMEHGWMWKTPIQTRIGSGLVYNRDLLSDDDAIKLFTEHWGEDRLITGKFNKIKWDPTYNAKNWRGNCVSIGLASGFLEPLESTGIALITSPIGILYQLIGKGWYGDTERDIFNNEMSMLYDDATDFVGMHYMNTLRTGPYWDYVRENWKTSETLDLKIKQHYRDLTRIWSTNDYAIMGDHSWNVWFHAVGIYGNPRPTGDNSKEQLIYTYMNHSKFDYTNWATNYEIMMKNRGTDLKNLPTTLSLKTGAV
jgi:hypothetical protein